MRFLTVAVVVMGVLIVAGVTLVAVVIAGRISAPAGPPMHAVLESEPAGTRIVAISALPDRLALQLQGGGPDRVVVLDMRTGREIGRVALAR